MLNTEASFVMMTSLNGNIFRVTGPLPVRGIHRWPLNSPRKGQWRGALIFSLINALKSGWANNRDAGDLRRHRAHDDVIAMNKDLTLSPACLSLIWYFYTTTGNVWIIPSFWGYVLHVEHVSYVTENCGQHQWVILSPPSTAPQRPCWRKASQENYCPYA